MEKSVNNAHDDDSHERWEMKKFSILKFFLPATEIRCQEKSKGGLRYEVILAEPNLSQVQIPKAAQQNGTSKPLSAEEIADKLKAAEERRLVRL